VCPKIAAELKHFVESYVRSSQKRRGRMELEPPSSLDNNGHEVRNPVTIQDRLYLEVLWDETVNAHFAKEHPGVEVHWHVVKEAMEALIWDGKVELSKFGIWSVGGAFTVKASKRMIQAKLQGRAVRPSVWKLAVRDQAVDVSPWIFKCSPQFERHVIASVSNLL
jgi:hypothetical protein